MHRILTLLIAIGLLVPAIFFTVTNVDAAGCSRNAPTPYVSGGRLYWSGSMTCPSPVNRSFQIIVRRNVALAEDVIIGGCQYTAGAYSYSCSGSEPCTSISSGYRQYHTNVLGDGGNKRSNDSSSYQWHCS